MSANPEPSRRLNPFAFPAETEVQFVLLLVAALAIELMLVTLLKYAVDPNASSPFAQSITSPPVTTPDRDFFLQVQRTAAQAAGAAFSSLGLPIVFLIVTFGVATVLYRQHAPRLRQQFDLKILTAEQDAFVHQEVEKLSAQMGITPPTIEANKHMRENEGQAFGFPPRYSIRLDGGLRQYVRSSPHLELFRTLVLHELGHIANEDVWRAYFGEALWKAMILLSVIPLLLAIGWMLFEVTVLRAMQQGLAKINLLQIITVNLPAAGGIILPIAILLIIAATIRASLLRTREVYADWRAAFGGAEASLEHILQSRADKEKSENRFTTLWRLHPSAKERLAKLHNPNALFHLTLDLPFVTGVFIAIILIGGLLFYLPAVLGVSTSLSSFIAALTVEATNTKPLSVIPLLYAGSILATVILLVAPVLGLAYLITWILGLQIQKQSLAEKALKTGGCLKYFSLLGYAALFALGMEIGFMLTPFASITSRNLLSALNGFLGTTFFIWLWLNYAQAYSPQFLGRQTGQHRPKYKTWGFNLVLSVLLCLFFAPLLANRVFIPALESSAQTAAQNAMNILLGVVCGIYLFCFGSTWVVLKTAAAVFPARCPSCQKPHHGISIGQSCKHCGHELAAWLFVEPSKQSDSPAPKPQTYSPL